MPQLVVSAYSASLYPDLDDPNMTVWDTEDFMVDAASSAKRRGVLVHFEQDPCDFGERRYGYFQRSGLDALEDFCKRFGYVLRRRKGGINVIPSSLATDPGYLLNLKIPYFRADREDPMRIFERLVAEIDRLYPKKLDLPPGQGPEGFRRLMTTEAREYTKDAGGKTKEVRKRYPKVSFAVRDTTVRGVLNKTAEGEGSYWFATYGYAGDPVLCVDFSWDNPAMTIDVMEDKGFFYDRRKYKVDAGDAPTAASPCATPTPTPQKH